MACIKGVNRSALAAFSPEGIYIAAGTMAGAVDLSFSSSASLEIFKLDFQADNQELPVVGASTSSEQFNRLSWGRNPSSGSEEFSMGLIAGGLVDGNIGLWNPHALICSEASENVLVTQLLRHRGPVHGLEFNALVPNHLASGADEGEICIWDIAKPAEPTHFPPLKGSGSATQGEISYLSWNSKVQHILASTSYNGTTVVWDLKRQKPALSIPDPYRRRCSVLQWHPDLATQLIVASDDDSSPSLRLWDMRNTMLPVREFVGHTKGVIAMSWCQSYSSYLLTCGKDNRTICWDTVSGEIVTELPAGTNWNFDIHWYPKIPGVISASSFDGKIGIYNIEGCSRFGTGEGNFGAALLRAPKWYKRKAGVSFGFGGKLVSFCSKDAPAGASEVYVHNLVAERSLVGRSSEFEAAIHDRDRSSLRLLCDRKSLESQSEDDRETWGLLKVMFEDDGTARTKLLTHFGFTLPFETKDTTEDNLSQEVSAIGLEDKVANKDDYVADKPPAYDNGEDFFDNLRSPKAETAVLDTGDSFNVGGSVPIVEEMQQETDGQEESDDPSFDDAIQCALVVGDYKVAVAHCISANKMADALVIAHVGGGSLWESTRDKYLKMSRSPYLKVVSAMFNNDLSSLVNTRPLKSWKETLALFCTFAQGEEWSSLCDLLASRLMTVGCTLPATLCYICSGNIDKTVEIWSRSLTIEYAGRSYVDHLQDLMEKTVILALATGQKQFSASLWKLIEKYAEILASQGLLTTAMDYLKLMGTEELSPELTILQDRIALSIEIEKEVSKSSALENSQSQPGTIYGADQSSFATAVSSGHYYQEASPSQEQQSVSGSPYGGNYQHSFSSSYVQGYGAPAPYQPAPQPQIFVPSQSLQVPQMNFAPSPVTTQPPVKPFVPATPVALRNVGQYQPPTLGSQLYPETGYGSLGPIPSQAGPSLGHKMPQVLAPNPASMGYIPSTNLRTQRPGMGPMQSSSPTQPSQLQPAVTPTTLPPTVQTVDTSSVAVRQRPVITTLTRLFNETSEALGGSRGNPAKKREIEDNSKKIGALFAKLNSGDISKNAAEKLVQLCLALDNGDFTTALQIQVQLTTSDWDECNFWLATLKRMIKTRQNVR